jgi:hypothetical protein
MKTLKTELVKEIFSKNKQSNLFGKWIRLHDIKENLEKSKNTAEVLEIGKSEEERPIYSIKLGNGSKRILIWTQMHGNESTGTKALFDVLNYFSNESDKNVTTILQNCTLLCIPMLNPDGAEKYTRVNGNAIDLNRDAVDRKAIESKLLRMVLENFNPHFCFNMHDQRTIFSVEGTKNPATVSFLAPSEEIERKITKGRKQTMNVIVAMNTLLQQIIPNHVGRYTDEFYPTATGDNFQKLGFNCILIESGHFYNDYERERSREFTFYGLLQGIYHIATAENYNDFDAYFEIPNNAQLFFDSVKRSEKETVGYQYKDEIIDGEFLSKLVRIEDFDENYKIGLNEIDFESE